MPHHSSISLMHLSSPTKATMLEAQKLTRRFDRDAYSVQVLEGVSLSVDRGEICALTGPSGSGKTTLMNLIGLLDRPTSGKLWIDGRPTLSVVRVFGTTGGVS